MKRTLLFFGLLTSVAYAQDCTKIFISEYVEGFGNNKAVEIYNPTNTTIDLSQYFVSRYSNGANVATVAKSVQLSGTIAPYDVFVAVLDKRDPNGTGNEAPIDAELEAKGDGFFSPVYATSEAFYWNGNDAIALVKGTLTSTPSQDVTTIPGIVLIDIFAKIGEDPGTSWDSDAPYNDNMGAYVTKDISLIRKSTVLKGVTTNPSAFNALAEYDSIPPVIMVDTSEVGNWASLGVHNCSCGAPLSISAKENPSVLVYPNPSLDGVIYVKNAAQVREVTVSNALGQVVTKITNNSNPVLSLNLEDNRGVYILRIVDIQGNVSSKRIVVK